ncbi:hypothetical protein RhiirA4_432201, partial [Rhizophagus irregularis]
MEEFSDIPQPDLPENETTDIPIFNMPETISLKIIPPQPERQADRKNTLLPNIKNTRAPVASTSGTSETSKLSESIEPINEVVNLPPKETPTDSSKPINEVSSAILLARAQREERLRKRAVELGENPDVFVTITKKDRLDSIAFRDRMKTDSQMCGYAEEVEEDPKEYMDMTVRERLIKEEIICRSFEEDGITSSWLDTDEEWKKT